MIALGSPFMDVGQVHPFTAHMLSLARQGMRPFLAPEFRDTCYTADCHCAFAQRLREQLPCTIAFTSMYTRTDGVVDWRACVDADLTNNVVVHGSAQRPRL